MSNVLKSKKKISIYIQVSRTFRISTTSINNRHAKAKEIWKMKVILW